ncbi:hypothetical protein NEPAR06_0316 [Nematocida parisii]|nr:hypothetical protein NEPAR06_0316 [Nematocida parisii]
MWYKTCINARIILIIIGFLWWDRVVVSSVNTMASSIASNSGIKERLTHERISKELQILFQKREELFCNISVWNYMIIFPFRITTMCLCELKTKLNICLHKYMLDLAFYSQNNEYDAEIRFYMIESQMIIYIKSNKPEVYGKNQLVDLYEECVLSDYTNGHNLQNNKQKLNLKEDSRGIYRVLNLGDQCALFKKIQELYKNNTIQRQIEKLTLPRISFKDTVVKAALELILSDPVIYNDFSHMEKEFIPMYTENAQFYNQLLNTYNLSMLVSIYNIIRENNEIQYYKTKNLNNITSICTEKIINSYHNISNILNCGFKVHKNISVSQQNKPDSSYNVNDAMQYVHSTIYGALATLYQNAPNYNSNNTELLGKEVFKLWEYMLFEIYIQESNWPSHDSEKDELKLYSYTNSIIYEHNSLLEAETIEHFHVYYVDNSRHRCHRVCIPYYFNSKGDKVCVHTVHDINFHLLNLFKIDLIAGSIFPYYTIGNSGIWNYMNEVMQKSTYVKSNAEMHILFYYIEFEFLTDGISFVHIDYLNDEPLKEVIPIPLFLNSLIRDSLKTSPFLWTSPLNIVQTMYFSNKIPDKHTVIPPIKRSDYIIHDCYKNLFMVLDDGLSVGVNCYTMSSSYTTVYKKGVKYSVIKWKNQIPTGDYFHHHYIYRSDEHETNSPQGLLNTMGFISNNFDKPKNTIRFCKVGQDAYSIWYTKENKLNNREKNIPSYAIAKLNGSVWEYARSFSSSKIDSSEDKLDSEPGCVSYLGVHYAIFNFLK